MSKDEKKSNHRFGSSSPDIGSTFGRSIEPASRTLGSTIYATLMRALSLIMEPVCMRFSIYLGHSQAKTTTSYAHLADETLRRVSEAISRAIV